jgi:hypothetical protein
MTCVQLITAMNFCHCGVGYALGVATFQELS